MPNNPREALDFVCNVGVILARAESEGFGAGNLEEYGCFTVNNTLMFGPTRRQDRILFTLERIMAAVEEEYPDFETTGLYTISVWLVESEIFSVPPGEMIQIYLFTDAEVADLERASMN